MTPEAIHEQESRDAAVALGQYIRDARLKKRETDPSFTLRQFALKLGISSTHLSRVEMGEGPASTDLLTKIADILDLDKGKLFELSGRIDPKVLTLVQKPVVLSFLRTLSGASDATLERINKIAQEELDKEKNGK